MFTLAAIDIGTNTVRLLIVAADDFTHYRPLHHEQEITRLGERFVEHGKLQPKARERTIMTLGQYARVAARHKADEVYAVATSAVREAANGLEFVKLVKQRTGITVTVIPPEKEAELASLGVQSVIHSTQPLLVVDIGGGSTEFIHTDKGEIVTALSLKIGVVKLQEQFLTSDPVDRLEYTAMLDYLNQALSSVRLTNTKDCALVGVAGTVTTLAAVDQGLVDYNPQLINNYILTYQQIQTIQDRFLAQPLALRRQTPGLEPGRADVIVAGTALLLCIMDKLGFASLVVCDSGLREGLVADRLKIHFATP